MRLGVPQNYTQVPPSSVRLTDTVYLISGLPAILSVKDIEWEGINGEACLVRRNLEKLGYRVEPVLLGKEKVIL